MLCAHTAAALTAHGSASNIPARITPASLHTHNHKTTHSLSVWHTLTPSHHDTLTQTHRSPAALALYRDHITAVTHRVNSLTGVRYRDDPTIMAWNLLNEPRWVSREVCLCDHVCDRECRG
jgi:hypothetical protein